MSNNNTVLTSAKKTLAAQSDSSCCSPHSAPNVTLIDSSQSAPAEIRAAVREQYGARARNADSCCDPNAGENKGLYDATLLSELPTDIANFTLGCGDPITLAELKPGETVLDLGSGGGLDCFLAARQVGSDGQVIGVDMTPEMLSKARANAARLNVGNVEFREGYLESLPVADNSVDVVISNCVINLSPDKPQVFREVFRVLKPGGRVAVSDIVTTGQLPEAVQTSMAAWGACVAGALESGEYTHGLKQAGFTNVKVLPKSETDKALAALPIGLPFSAVITATKGSAGVVEEEQPAKVTLGNVTSAGLSSSEVHTMDMGTLMQQVTSINAIADGYEVVFNNKSHEIEALIENIIRAEATQFSFLHFDLQAAPEGLHLRLTSKSAKPVTGTSA